MLLTVFTSTLNRAGLLPRIFESIVRQKRTDIEWLVVDDGSEDDTPEIIAEFARKVPFPIRYYRQPRGGKHRAYNMALLLARGELMLTLDSDDWLPDKAVDMIEEYMPIVRCDKKICGMIALKADANGNIYGREMSGKVLAAGDNAKYEEVMCTGERCIILKTDVARQYPFPTVEGELFMTESVMFSRLSIDYGFAIVNKVLSYCEYQSDGLTQNIHTLLCQNPVGFMLYHSQRINQATTLKAAIGAALRYVAFRSMAGVNGNAAEHSGKYEWLIRLLSPLGPIGKLYYFIRNRQHI